MLKRIIDFSLRNTFLVLLGTVLLILGGGYAARHIPLDAIPDLSDTQVIIYTEWNGQAPNIIEDQVTYPITTKMLSVPRSKVVRGYSFYGYSFVYVIFEDGTDPYWARSRVLEYLSSIGGQLPKGVTPSLGPDATGVGWAFMYSLNSTNRDLAELRSLQDWYLKYQLTSVPGVSEVASVGGFVKQYQVTVDPTKLRAYNLSLSDVSRAIERSNGEVGGRSLELAEREFILRVKGYITSLDDLKKVAVGTGDRGVPILLRDVANIQFGPDMRRGIAEANGEGETVGGIVIVRYGANAYQVIQDVKARLAESMKALPDDVKVTVNYDRTSLIDRAVKTLEEKLLEESIVVALVCFAFLLHLRSALVAIVILPVAVLIALLVMFGQGISSNIMSLGGIAIAIGAMVDAAIIMIENAHKHLERSQGQKPHWEIIRDAAVEVGPTLFYSLLVITVSFLPVFTLQEQEGRLFKPLAFTKTYSMAAAALLSISLAPVLMGWFIRGKIPAEERNPVNRALIWIYHPVLNFVVRWRKLVILAAVLVVVWVFFPWNQVVLNLLPQDVPVKAALASPSPQPSPPGGGSIVPASVEKSAAGSAESGFGKGDALPLSPLPRGEGQGEGERGSHPDTTTQSFHPNSATDSVAANVALGAMPPSPSPQPSPPGGGSVVPASAGNSVAGSAENGFGKGDALPLSPLPRGEGQGEGERGSHPDTTTQSFHPNSAGDPTSADVPLDAVLASPSPRPSPPGGGSIVPASVEKSAAGSAESGSGKGDALPLSPLPRGEGQGEGERGTHPDITAQSIHPTSAGDSASADAPHGATLASPSPRPSPLGGGSIVPASVEKSVAGSAESGSGKSEAPTTWRTSLRRMAASIGRLFPYQNIGSEFMPPLYEGDLLYMPTTFPGISPTKAREVLQVTDRLIKSFPEVAGVFGKAGRAETATDPAPLDMIETTIRLKPESEWPAVDIKDDDGKVIAHRRRTPDELTDALNDTVQIPGLNNAWTMPIRTRIDMLSTGIKTPVGIKIAGPDLATLEHIGTQVEAVVRRVPGTTSAFAERVMGGRFIEFTLDRDAIARYGLTVADVQDVLSVALGGTPLTTTVEGLQRYTINLRYDRDFRSDLRALREDIVVPTPGGAQIPLGQLAAIQVVDGPMGIKSEGAVPNAWVYVDIRGVDVGTYVQMAMRAVNDAVAHGEIVLPGGYNLFWSGQYEYMLHARERLMIVVPLTLLLITLIIYLNTQSLLKTAIVMLAVPFSLVGAFWAVYLCGYNMSVAVWVGIIALAGLDAETGVVMLLYLELAYAEWQQRGALHSQSDLHEAIYHGAVKRVRPKAMTACVIIAGLAPILFSHGAGADVMKRIATPMVGGVITSTIMELAVYPAIYFLWRSRGLKA